MLNFIVSEEKEEEEETEDAGLDDWEAMVSDEDGEKGGHVNTKRMLFLIKRFLWAESFISAENILQEVLYLDSLPALLAKLWGKCVKK